MNARRRSDCSYSVLWLLSLGVCMVGCEPGEESTPADAAIASDADTTAPPDSTGETIEDTSAEETSIEDTSISDVGLDTAPDASSPTTLTPKDALCTVDGWCWTYPKPLGALLLRGSSAVDGDVWAITEALDVAHFNATGATVRTVGIPLNAVHARASDDVWFTGGDAFVHFDGTTWLRYSAPAKGFSTVFARTREDAWAVGVGGVIAHWNGTTWSASLSGDKRDLLNVFAIAANDVWAVGNNGARLHFDGTKWTATTDGATPQLSGLWAADGKNVFACGQFGVALRWDGATWTSISTGSSETYWSSIWGTSAKDLWVSTFGFAPGTIARYDGTSWSTVRTTSSAFNTVTGTSATNIWAVGYGVLDRWNGSMWTAKLDPVILQEARDLQGRAANDLWAVGSGAMRWDGSKWSAVDIPTTDVWNGVFAIGASDVVAVGRSKGTIARFDGTKWTTTASGISQLYDVWASSASDVWATGNGQSAHWNGSKWTTFATGDLLYGVSGTAASDVWAVGEVPASGGVVQHWNGTAWTRTTVAKALNAVFARTPTDVWAVGRSGVVAHYDGTTWTLSTAETTAELTSVIAFASNDVWVSGGKSKGGGVVQRWDGSKWSAHATNTLRSLLLWGSTGKDLHAVGNLGAMRRVVP